MSLLARVNLTLGIAFLVGVGVSGIAAHTILQNEAKQEGLRTVQLMLASAAASRDYTRTEIAPLLLPHIGEQFSPQMVPAYAATQSLERLRKEQGDYIYREATLNPTNPRDRATDWEADIVNELRSNANVKQVSGERMTPAGPSLYMARPLRVTGPDCLVCHGASSAAPPTMTAIYGTTNGFGWQPGEVIGAQIMSVPMATALAKADHEFVVFIVTLVGIFIIVFVVVNIMLRLTVLRPISRMAAFSDEVSRGNLDAPAFEPTGNDEIAQLGRSLERMRRSLAKSLDLLGG